MILGLITWSWVTCVRCSWSQPWAFRSWAPSSQEPSRFCGRKPVSPSRPGPPRWKASSTASPSLAWCWMSKVPKRVIHKSPHNPILLNHFFFFFFFLLFRWENLWQGPCGDHARERGEAEPTVGARTAVKTSRTTWELHWKPELLQPATRIRDGGKLPELLHGCEWSHRGAATHNSALHISLSFCFGKKVWHGRAGKKKWRRRRLVRLQLLCSQLPLEKRTTYWTPACKWAHRTDLDVALLFSRALTLTFSQHECLTEIWVFKLSPSCLDDFRFRQMLGQQKQPRVLTEPKKV